MRLIQMARQNAADELGRQTSDDEARAILLLRLKHRLKMDRLPMRIECFDNSNILGTSPVSGMVVFQNGAPCSRKAYRKYIIQTVEKPDDYAAMAEVLKQTLWKR